MKNPLLTSSTNLHFFTEKRFIYQEICPRKPNETRSDARERLQCLRDSVDKTKLKQQGEKLKKPENLLTNEEIPLMDKSINTIFKSLLQSSFYLNAELIVNKEKIIKAMKLAVEHHGALTYKKVNGSIVIRKRKSVNNPAIDTNFKIVIYNGFVNEVNGHTITHNKQDGWAKTKKKMEKIYTEIQEKEMRGLGMKDWNFKDKPSWQIFEFYNLKMFKILINLMKLKAKAFGKLNSHEQNTLQKLQTILNDPSAYSHPADKAEMKSDPNSKLKFYVTHKKGNGDSIEFLYPISHPKRFQTFAAISLSGLIRKNEAPGFPKPVWSNSSKSFADLYKTKHKIP